MSTKENKKNCSHANFSEVWERIVQETDIKYLKDLGELVCVTQQNVSLRKQENLFPFGWAYPVAKKYNLLTEWLLTGEGPKRLNNRANGFQYRFTVLKEIDTWLQEEMSGTSTEKNSWLSMEFQRHIPEFREWKKRREDEKGQNSEIPDRNIA